MAIIAAGVRYDPINGIQATIVVTDDNGGKASDLNPHILHAAQAGHTWINIDAATYSAFTDPKQFVAYINSAISAIQLASVGPISNPGSVISQSSSSGSGASAAS
jgi:hypothetical protein